MKLYVKQKAFSWKDKFFIKDERGEDRYYAQGRVFSWNHQLYVYDAAGNEAAYIRRKTWSWRPRYYIDIDGKTYTLAKQFTFLRQKLYIEQLPITLDGNFSAHEYTMDYENRRMMRMSKHWFTWGDSYELDIADPAEALLCLCITLAVDCMAADAASSSSASSS